jgi:hypothetical protein
MVTIPLIPPTLFSRREKGEKFFFVLFLALSRQKQHKIYIPPPQFFGEGVRGRGKNWNNIA